MPHGQSPHALHMARLRRRSDIGMAPLGRLSIVQESCRFGAVKRRPQECNKLHRTGKAAKPISTYKPRRYIIGHEERRGQSGCRRVEGIAPARSAAAGRAYQDGRGTRSGPCGAAKAPALGRGGGGAGRRTARDQMTCMAVKIGNRVLAPPQKTPPGSFREESLFGLRHADARVARPFQPPHPPLLRLPGTLSAHGLFARLARVAA